MMEEEQGQEQEPLLQSRYEVWNELKIINVL